MMISICPKLPMRNKAITKYFYVKLGFRDIGSHDFPQYLILQKEQIEIHFFEFKDLDTKENYGQVYIRTTDIDVLYKSFIRDDVKIHPNGGLKTQPWGQKEFSLLDPDNNLLTFGQSV
ncbi:VOC family protein [Pedobacter sp. SD-b]|uniref:VOC family protein n=1 Tax=Pedobacter segetis TaxID=2793069 RepID=A0ABS1BF11_9SPHI|nr:VOC family protein [Pedobacter segetis]MBK0381454.1 VOC family protein [Pedobacter segetis]